jgi:hypothetical protein
MFLGEMAFFEFAFGKFPLTASCLASVLWLTKVRNYLGLDKLDLRVFAILRLG